MKKPEQLVDYWFNQEGGNNANDSLLQGLTHLFQVIKENRWGIIIIMILGCVAGVFKAVSEKPVYQARLTMAVEPSSVRASTQAVFDPYAFRFYETQYELLKSRSVAEKVVERLKLTERSSIQQLLVAPSMFRSLAAEATSITGIKLLPDEEPVAITAQSVEDIAKRKAWLTAIIQNGVNVSGGEKTNLVEVTFNSINPTFAAEIANALVDAYIELGMDSQLNRTQQTTQWLSQRIVEMKKTLDEAQVKLQSYLIEEDMLDSVRSNQITTNELQALNQEYLQARARMDDLNKRYGSKHPRIAKAREDVKVAKARLDSKSKNISSTRIKQLELARLERDVEVNQELYEAFLSKFKEADLSSSGSQVASARIVDKALPPSQPIYPKRDRIIITWGIGGLLLGVLLAFLREQLDTTFKTGRSIEEKLGLPLFGILQTVSDSSSLVERHYLVDKRSVFSESVNHIRTGITYSNIDNPPKVILITSSVQSEGKTTIAYNLALSYAQLGKTLLIDADLRRPRIAHITESQGSQGLVDYVAGLVSLEECVNQDKEEEQLSVLNAGIAPPNPLELLASDKFSKIISDLRSKYSYIIIDTAPVLPASDAVVLGQLCDALLMVVQSDRTTYHMVRDAVKRLHASKVGVEGVILSQTDVKKGSPYQYGGYYGYGKYAYIEDSK